MRISQFFPNFDPPSEEVEGGDFKGSGETGGDQGETGGRPGETNCRNGNYRLKNFVKFLPYLADNLWGPYFTANSSDFDEIFEAFEALNNDTVALNNA